MPFSAALLSGRARRENTRAMARMSLVYPDPAHQTPNDTADLTKRPVALKQGAGRWSCRERDAREAQARNVAAN